MLGSLRVFVYFILLCGCQIKIALQERIRTRSGGDILLNCDGHREGVKWRFKHCNMTYKGLDCEGAFQHDTVNWKTLSHKNNRRKWKITNATEKDSGIYECYKNEYLLKTYFVEIVETCYKDCPSPKVLVVEATNISIEANTHLALKCNVSSESPPDILWFKECFRNDCDDYFSAYYDKLSGTSNCLCKINTSSRIMTHGNYYYLSKLNIFNAQYYDNGIYICAVLSAHGSDYKNIEIRINNEIIYRKKKAYVPVYFLLAIPAFLALLYLAIKCYFNRKRKRLKTIEKQNELLRGQLIVSA